MGRRKKVKAKPVIAYPQLTLKKWVPPDQRKKKKHKKPPPYPPQVTTITQPCSLRKVWHSYNIIHKCAVLLGNYSLLHTKFNYVTNGYQGSAICVMAVLFSKLIQCPNWNSHMLDTILTFGDRYYTVCRKQYKTCNCKLHLKIPQLLKELYLYDYKITVEFKGPKFVGGLYEDKSDETMPQLVDVIKIFFSTFDAGVISMGAPEGRNFAIWKFGKGFFLFDPTDHDDMCWPWKGLPGKGVSFLIRFPETDQLVQVIQRNMPSNNTKFEIFPVVIDRIVLVNTKYPDCIKDANLVDLDKRLPKKFEDEIGDPSKPKEAGKSVVIKDDGVEGEAKPDDEGSLEVEEEEESEEEAVGENVIKATPSTPAAAMAVSEGGDSVKRPPRVKRMPVVEAPKVASVTYFCPLDQDKLRSILMAETSKTDPEFERCPRQDTFSAVAALVMLREVNSKYWTSRVVTNVLRLGFRICMETKKFVELNPELNEFKLKAVERKITLNEKHYLPEITTISCMGKLLSTEPTILDLLPALEQVLARCDTVVVQGPNIVSVWKEGELYYMFDPGERDPNGSPILKEIRVGSVMETVDFISGASCVMRFRDLEDLAKVYMNNVEKPRRKDPFVISNVEIKDFVERPEDWFNFKALEPMRWILFGHFSQADPRFEPIARSSQCTASAAMCLAYLHIKPIAQWDKDTMDHILIEGNTYYNHCVETLKACDKYVSPMLYVPELVKSFVVDKQLVVLDIEECLFNGAISIEEKNNKLSLSNVLREFFKDYDFGIVTSCGISVAVFKKGDGYFYFDSHSRDEQGLHICHGKACIQRVTSVRKLADCILANLALKSDLELFNIAGVKVDVFQESLTTELDEDDDELLEGEEEEEEEEEEDPVAKFNVLMPELYYTRLTKKRAILRSRVHQGDPIFGTNAGKQSVPNMMAAIGLANLYQARFWDVNNVDDILHHGDAMYTKSVEDNCLQVSQPPEGEDDLALPYSEEITTENVVKTFKIGVNKFTVEFGEAQAEEIGVYGEGLRTALKEFLKKERKDDESRKEAIIKTPTVNLVIWRDGNLYYLFDPNARDNRGEVYGKDEWSLYYPPIEEEEEEIIEIDEPIGEDESVNEGEEENMDYIVNYLEDEWKAYGEEGEDVEEIEESQQWEEPKPKHPPEYWKDLEEKNGKACVIWFTKLRHLIKHIVNNNPPQKIEDEFTITPITVTNEVELVETKPWSNFEAFDDHQWILRGNMSQNHEMFPAGNRGAQGDANCLLFLAHSELFSLTTYNKNALDEILKYGDRLYTYAKKLRRKQLQELKDSDLYPSEIEALVARDTYTIDKLPKQFCIGDNRLKCTSNDNFVIGEVYDKTSPTSLNNTLPVFFKEPDNYCAILTSKGVSVGLRQALNRYYMFDPQPRGPKAQPFEGGVACLTRYSDLQQLAEVFLKTLPALGKNFFSLHRILAEPAICGKQVREEIKRVDDPLKIYGFVPVFPGKMMIRGTISQDEPRFGRGTNAQCSPIAFVALAMTLIHNCEFWTKPIIDEIIAIGDRIYGDLLDRCDFDFNPWEEHLTVEKTPRDFKIGKINVNCELRDTTQSGIIDIIDPQIINIRQGIERFFEENSYGVIETENLTVAVWEAEDEESSNWIYMFDPNPRGQTGQPLQEAGMACAVKFCGSKIMADHIVSLLHSEREGRFTIYPVEIVIERDGKKKKTKKYGLTPVKRDGVGKNKKLGRCAFYEIPNTEMRILRGMKNHCDDSYSSHSRGNQGIPNCIVSYVMDKLIPISRWNFKTIDMILDVGDQLYKDSFILYNPIEKKLPLESLIRDIVIKDVRVKISVGAPVLAANLDKKQLWEALEACFNLKSFCVLIVDCYTVSIFKKEDSFFIFDPAGMDLTGKSDVQASAAILQVPNFESLIDVLMENASGFEGRDETFIHRVFKIIVIGIKEIQKVPVGATFDDRYRVAKKEQKNCDKVRFTTCAKRKKKRRSPEEEEDEGQE